MELEKQLGELTVRVDTHDTILHEHAQRLTAAENFEFTVLQQIESVRLLMTMQLKGIGDHMVSATTAARERDKVDHYWRLSLFIAIFALCVIILVKF